MMVRRGVVYVDDQQAGIIDETADGYVFSYDSAYLSQPGAQAVSLTLPLRAHPYISTSVFPFFHGLLAEGALAEIQCRTLKIDERDTFGRLLVSCQETIGAVTVRAAPLQNETP